MFRLFEMADSGNCYKVRLLLNQLDIAYERVPTDILQGESRTDAFLALNPNGKVPLLILPDGRPLAESNAMLCYLATGTPMLPDDSYLRALTLQWLFFEQYSHEPFIATNRFWIHILKDPQGHAAQIAERHPRGVAALGVMERHLSERRFFVDDRYGIADIALYAYSHVAHEGGYDLKAFPNLRAWLARVAAQPRHIPIHA
ncbi:MAG: glutathione S-transferase family protein [Pseudomonadales bacterium]